MAKSKFNLTTALAVAMGLSLTLLTTPVSAGKRDPSPPPGGQRDVIADAEVICLSPPTDLVADACGLRGDTNGELQNDGVCDLSTGVSGDAGIVDYSLRNCGKNEESLLRYASSAVLSLDDFAVRDKLRQATNAADKLCDYAVKYALLVGAGKLLATVDLGEEAEGLAVDITGTDFYCD